MSNRNWIAIVLVVIAGLCALCVGAALIGGLLFTNVRTWDVSSIFDGPTEPNVVATAEESQTFEIGTPATLEVVNRFGDVNITAVEGTTDIQVLMTKNGYGNNQQEAELALSQIEVAVEQTGDQLRLEVTSSDRLENRIDKSVAFDIQVPVETTVVVDSQTGAISLAGTQGKADLDTDFGALEVTDFAGGLAVRTASGSIAVRRVTLLDSGDGDITLISDFGAIRLEDARSGVVQLSSRSGQVHVENLTAGGDVTIGSEFGEVEWRTGTAEALEVQSRSGQVVLADLTIAGEVQASSTFGEIRLTDVQAAGYTLHSDSGRISASGVSGPLEADSQQNDISISGGEIDQLTIESGSGSVNFRGALGEGPHQVKTTFGNITLSLPEDSAFDYDLRTERGLINNDFDEAGSDSSDTRQSGSANGGGEQLTVESLNGSIELLAIP